MTSRSQQDRSCWDREVIAQGAALVRESLRGGRPGRFVLQAAIAALHAQAPSYAETDWPQIVGLYDVLLRVWSSPVVALNRAVAVAMAQGPAAGLAQIGELEADGRLAGYRYLPAAKADLLRRLGNQAEAARGGREPGCGVARHPLPGPRGERGGVGVLHAFLGQVEVPGDARRRGEHEGPLATVRIGDRFRHRCRAVGGAVTSAAHGPVTIGRDGAHVSRTP